MIIHSSAARHICVLLGYFYPSLASAKAAVQQDPAAFTQWMTYWVVISFFAVVEILFDFFVSWVPFYFEAKIVLIIWLTLPRYQGARQIYHRVIYPYLVHYEGDIDNGLEGMRVEATRRIQSLGASAATEIAKVVTRQGYSAKDQLLTHVLGVATVGAKAAMADSAASKSAPSSPVLRVHALEGRDRWGSTGGVGGDSEADADAVPRAAVARTESNATMLEDFLEIMRGGVFVMARASFGRGGGGESLRSRRIRVLSGRQFCMDDSNEGMGTTGSDMMDVEGENGTQGKDHFKVCEVRADPASDKALVLGTDRGDIALALQSVDDRDTLLMGFDLLLTNPSPDSPSSVPSQSANVLDAVDQGKRGYDEMNVEFDESNRQDRRRRVGDEGADSSSGEHAMQIEEAEYDDEDMPPASISPLRQNLVEVE